jgi:hypothetical protein
MEAWDVIVKQINHFNDGPKSKKLDHHDGLDFDDELNGKQLFEYVVPKVASCKGVRVVKGLNPTYKYLHYRCRDL